MGYGNAWGDPQPMKDLTVGIVSEGPIDFDVLANIFIKIVPGKHRFLPIQPDLSETQGLGVARHSNGWKGVFSWCESYSGKIYEFLNETQVEVLIIQIDADVARDHEINCARPCPHAEDTVVELENLIKQRLDIAGFDNKIICCIPSDNTEAWILTAFDDGLMYHGANKHIECVNDPDDIISKDPFKLLRRKNGKPKKNQILYRDKLIPKVIDKWDYIREFCSQAEKLHQALLKL